MTPLFYIKDTTDNSIWEILEYDISDQKRLGWLNGRCIDAGDDPKNYIGADIGVDAKYVFEGARYDFAKDLKYIIV